MSNDWFRTDTADLYVMANLSPKETGLPVTVFCSPKGRADYDCRVKVSNITGGINEHDVFSVSVNDFSITSYCKLSQDDLQSVKRWIHLNRVAILDYWNGQIDTLEFLNSLKPITAEE